MTSRRLAGIVLAVLAAGVAVTAGVWWRFAPSHDERQSTVVNRAEAAVALPPTGISTQIVLRDVTAQSGITFRHTDGSAGRYRIVETVSAGLATFDYNRDGLIDIYFVNGAPERDALQQAENADPPRSTLYRNLGNWKFQDVTAAAGAGLTGFGLGVAVGDYDGDGHPDLYVTNYGPNVLLRNNGDGTFADVTAEAGVAGPGLAGAGAVFLDADGDGDLDLYAANYLDFVRGSTAQVTVRGVPVYPSPERFPPVADSFFRNNGDGTFTDAGRASGIAAHASWGMGMVAGDYDDDGDTDLFVGNDVAANFLFRNDGSGRFEEVGLVSGVAYDLYGNAQGSMGADCGDYNNDGRLDFYQTSYQLQHAVLYENLGGGAFEDVALISGAATGTYPHVTWGCALADFDNDGDRDLFVGCGHLQDRVEEYDKTTAYRARNLLLMNDGTGRFRDVSSQCGDGLAVVESSRGVAVDDLDNDGRLDVVVLNARGRPTLLRNESGGKNHWLAVQLAGAEANRDGVGARVRVVAGELVLVDEVHAGRGYQSHFGTRLHFGLGHRTRVDRVEVRWIGGGESVVANPGVDRLITVEAAGETP